MKSKKIVQIILIKCLTLPTTNFAIWSQDILNKLTLEQKIAQLFIIGVNNADYAIKSDDHIQDQIINAQSEHFRKEQAKELITKYKVGGVHFVGYGTLKSCYDAIKEFQLLSEIPLLISQDFEWGLSMRLKDAMCFPKNKFLGTIEDENLIYKIGKEIGRQCKLLGVHINFSPVIDINNNPNNVVIGARSFGDDKENVAKNGLAMMQGLQDAGIIACAKHFPGHGDTNVDSHHDLPIIKHNLDRIENLELFPFKELINNGVKSIMTAHILFPCIDEEKPATLSYKVITNLLQNKLGFNGLIITDALNMKAINKNYLPGESDLEAFLAGNDILLMSENVPKAIDLIKNKILEKKFSEEELNKRVLKILKTKEELNLNKNRFAKPFKFNNFHTKNAKELKEKLEKLSQKQ